MSKQLLQIPAAEIVPGNTHGDFSQLIGNHLAVCFRDFFSEGDLQKTIEGVYNGSDDWSEGYEGAQFCLGEAWYHYAEEGHDFEEYTEKTEHARAMVEKYVPGLEKKVFGFLSAIAAPLPVRIRKGWAGPGIMIFPPQGFVAQNGGSVHFDLDAFSQEELDNPNLQVFSFICMLQKPESGGNLTVWRKKYDPTIKREENFFPDVSGLESAVVEYRPGDLWMLNGLSAHQIGAFQGETDRICLTFHIYRNDNEWLLWF